MCYRYSLLLLLLMMAACSQQVEETTPAVELEATDEPVVTAVVAMSGLAFVENVQLILIETMPVGVELNVQGNLPDSCTQIDAITQTQTEQRFDVVITTQRDADASCTQALVPFEEKIALQVNGLPAGAYTVDVNGVQNSFVFGMDNVAPPEPTSLPPTVEEPTQEAVPEGFDISGLVFHDVCAVAEDGATALSEGCVESADNTFIANGTLEAGEPPLVGVVVELLDEACVVEVESAETDSSGAYKFANIPTGSYCLTIVSTDEPNASILIPGQFTTPDTTGELLLSVSEDTVVAPFGWDFQFLPIPEVEQTDTLVVEANCGDRVSFWGDVTVPDDTPFEPGAPIVKTWRLINTGGCTWNSEYGLQFAEGSQMQAPDFVPFDKVVPPGGEIDVTVRMTAPNELGTHRGDWLFRNDDGELFGLGEDIENTIFTQIEVVAAGTLGQISGFVWSDLCDQTDYLFGQPTLPPGCLQNENGTIRGDGVFDVSSEIRLANVTVTLGSGECGEADVTLSTTVTNADGIYRFESLPSATYCVYIDVITEENYNLLVPGLMTAPQVGRTGFTVTLQPDQELTTLNFGWDFTEEE